MMEEETERTRNEIFALSRVTEQSMTSNPQRKIKIPLVSMTERSRGRGLLPAWRVISDPV
jgi:hypothetical protein